MEVTVVSGNQPYAVEIHGGPHAWHADEPVEAGGGDSGPNPKSLLLGSLGACMAITVCMYAARKQWSLQGVSVRLRLLDSGANGDGTGIDVQIDLAGELTAADRERLLHVANACPIHRLLTGHVDIFVALAGPARTASGETPA